MTVVSIFVLICILGALFFLFLKVACFVLSFKDDYDRRNELKKIYKNNEDYLVNQAREKSSYSAYTNDRNTNLEIDKVNEYLDDSVNTVAVDGISNESNTFINKELEPYIKALGLQEDVSLEKVKEAFRISAKKYHPSYGTEPNEDKYNQLVEYRDILINIFNKG